MGTIYQVGADSRGFEDAYAEPLAEHELPRYRMPQEKADPRKWSVSFIRDELTWTATRRRTSRRSARRMTTTMSVT